MINPTYLLKRYKVFVDNKDHSDAIQSLIDKYQLDWLWSRPQTIDIPYYLLIDLTDRVVWRTEEAGKGIFINRQTIHSSAFLYELDRELEEMKLADIEQIDFILEELE